MTDKDRQILRDERVRQLTINMGQRAGMAKAIKEAYGEEGVEVLRKEVVRDISAWIQSVRKSHEEQDIPRDIDGIHSFLWGPNKDENMEISYTQEGSRRTYKITHCPLAEFAHEQGIPEWGKFFFCSTYRQIAQVYNPQIEFNQVSSMMEGDSVCELYYDLD